MNMLMSATPNQTMSSREIASMCQKDHKNVTVVIESLIDANILTAEIQRSTFEHRGNTYKCFLLNKRDSLVVVARLSPEFTAAVVDRWQELEA
ncbi:MAG: Rha family transcriptional regulator, partial [Moraxellaceae bacterium]